jgi:3-deoxy-D-manno-octulosonate 8-phosphate phosphatase KdsC-like HAD superfamily phosphatase
MNKTKLEEIKHLTIADILDFVPVMTMGIEEARAFITEYVKKHNIKSNDIKTIGAIVIDIGLYNRYRH